MIRYGNTEASDTKSTSFSRISFLPLLPSSKNTTNCFNYLFIQQIIRIFAPSIQIKKVMTQLILNIENPAILPSLRKVLNAIDGVSIAKSMKKTRHKSELDLAIEDVKNGMITRWESVDSLIEHINSIAK